MTIILPVWRKIPKIGSVVGHWPPHFRPAGERTRRNGHRVASAACCSVAGAPLGNRTPVSALRERERERERERGQSALWRASIHVYKHNEFQTLISLPRATVSHYSRLSFEQ